MVPKTKRLTQDNEYWIEGFFLSKRAEGCSPKTIADYRLGLSYLVEWATAQGKSDITALKTNDLKGFLAAMRTTTGKKGTLLSAKSVRNTWVAMRSFYRWLAEENEVPNLSRVVTAPKATVPVIDPLSRDEVSAMLKACEEMRPAKTVVRRSFTMRRSDAVRDKTIVLMLLDTGLRAGELCDLVVEDVELSTGKVDVRSGKGDKPRTVYLGKVARKALWRYMHQRGSLRGDDSVFVNRLGGKFQPDRLATLFKRLGARAGVRKLHPHRLRHTFATEFLRNGGNLLGLQRLLGHTSLEMVRRYAAIVEADLAKAHETGSPADKWRL